MQKLFVKSYAALSAMAVFLTCSMAYAADEAAGHANGLTAVGVALGMGLAVLGGALGQSKPAAAALEGIARNPSAADKVLVPLILGLSFIESLVLFALVIMLKILP